MASYFYLMSSLPMLKVCEQMPIKYEQFLDYCKGSVSEKNFNILKNLTPEANEGPLIKEWSRFYEKFNNELSYQRLKRLSRPANQNFDKDFEATKAISAAMADSNPLNAEKILLLFLFDKLDSLVGTHTFDDYALFGYALKLKLLERYTSFDQNKGKQELKFILKAIEEKVEKVN